MSPEETLVVEQLQNSFNQAITDKAALAAQLSDAQAQYKLLSGQVALLKEQLAEATAQRDEARAMIESLERGDRRDRGGFA